MKGDFTRFTHNKKKHYIGVFKQQGRVSLDADYNENIMIQTQRNQQEISDIIGNGVPIGQNRENIDAFKIQSLNGNGFDFIIHSGRIYVNGQLCELENISGEHQTSGEKYQHC